jgi:hypothetical protein
MKPVSPAILTLLIVDALLVGCILPLAIFLPSITTTNAQLYKLSTSFYNESGLKIDINIGNSGTSDTTITNLQVGTSMTSLKDQPISATRLESSDVQDIVIPYAWTPNTTYTFKLTAQSGKTLVWPEQAPPTITERTVPDAQLKVINPLTGDSNFNFTGSQKHIDDTFIIKIEVVNVTNLLGWQFNLKWDPNLLSFVNVSVPLDTIVNLNFFPGGIDSSTPGQLVFGGYKPAGYAPFNGTCILAQVTLKITQGFGHSDFAFKGIPLDTFLFGNNIQDIPFNTTDGNYNYTSSPS